MLTQHVALVSEIEGISGRQLTRAAAALQKQVIRDFGPIWGVRATVAPFVSLDDVPVDYWPVMIRDDIGYAGAAGIHLDKDGQPFALVQMSNQWPLTASHEVLEMLADPYGSRIVAGQSIKPGQGRVEYLLEVCDPCEDDAFAYRVNGIMVSDFYTPQFFDPVTNSGVRYSFTGSIVKPRQVLKGGYLSWHEPVSDHWWQAQYFGAKLDFADLGVLTGHRGSVREWIDARTFREKTVEDLPKGSAALKTAVAAMMSIEAATTSKARAYRAQIEEIKARYGGGEPPMVRVPRRTRTAAGKDPNG